jgi:hypothetical protein
LVRYASTLSVREYSYCSSPSSPPWQDDAVEPLEELPLASVVAVEVEDRSEAMRYPEQDDPVTSFSLRRRQWRRLRRNRRVGKVDRWLLLERNNVSDRKCLLFLPSVDILKIVTV